MDDSEIGTECSTVKLALDSSSVKKTLCGAGVYFTDLGVLWSHSELATGVGREGSRNV